MAVIVATGEKVIVCDKCEALCRDGVTISKDTLIGMSTYLEA